MLVSCRVFGVYPLKKATLITAFGSILASIFFEKKTLPKKPKQKGAEQP